MYSTPFLDKKTTTSTCSAAIKQLFAKLFCCIHTKASCFKETKLLLILSSVPLISISVSLQLYVQGLNILHTKHNCKTTIILYQE